MWTRRTLTASLLTLAVCATSDLNATPYGDVHSATFAAPCAYPMDARPGAPVPWQPTFRWGWFGAEHFPPAPQLHRDYNQGWLEWHYWR